MPVQYLKDYGPLLLDRAYSIVELPFRQKGPQRRGWQREPLTREMIERLPPTMGVGVLCGIGEYPLVGLDFDIPDNELAADVYQCAMETLPQLAVAPYRVGHAPKFLLAARAAEAGWRKRSTPAYVKDGVKAQLEVLGAGQQFVAYNQHPVTREPYTWLYEFLDPKLELSGVDAKDLPVVTADDVSSLMDAVCRLFEEHGYTADRPAASQTFTPSDEQLVPATPPVPGMTLEKARAVFETIKPQIGSGAYDEWLKIGMALHHQFGGSADALALWDELSLKFGAEAYQDGACERKWQSFKDTQSGDRTVTMRTYLKAYQAKENPECRMLNEQGLYARFVRDYGDCVVWLEQKGVWYAFDRDISRWNNVSGRVYMGGMIRDMITKGLLRELESADKESEYGKALAKFYWKCLNSTSSCVNKVFRQAENDPIFDAVREDFDAKPNMFLCKNGVLDLSNAAYPKLIQNKAGFKLLREAGTEFDPYAKCPVWERTVFQNLGEDAEKVRFFQALMGSALSAEKTDETFVLMRGVGNNGKSLILETLRKVFGGYAEILGEESLLGKTGLGEGGRARSDLARLPGARFVYCSETSESNRLKEADVKRMTSHEPFPARAPYDRADTNVFPTWRLVMVTNHKPTIRGTDDGIWRRIADIEFPRNFDIDPKVKKDPLLGKKLEAELPGILNWLIEGLRVYREEGLKVPEVVAEATKEYREDEDLVRSWFNERLVRDKTWTPDKEIKDDELYLNFLSWMQMNGEQCFYSKRAFRQRVGTLYRGGAIEKEWAPGKECWKRSKNIFRLRGYRFAEPADDKEFDG